MLRRAFVALTALTAALTVAFTGTAAATPAASQSRTGSVADGVHGHHDKLRTVVTTDMEQDDYASLIRYLLYTNDLDTEGIIYTSSKFHWAGDGKGTEFFLPGREYTTPQTSWRWTGTRTIQDEALKAYDEVYPNLRRHDPEYPSPAELRSKVKIGNIVFEGEMDQDTVGSNLIKRLLLDNDPRTLYLQAWGGTNTIARALKSIEDQYGAHRGWPVLKAKISAKAVILASGFQDQTYADYIAPNWPALRVEQLSGGYAAWGYNCNRNNQGNIRGLPEDRQYFQGTWIQTNIQTGPYGKLYRSWLDGQAMPGDQLDIFGIPELAPSGWCKPLEQYDFLSEGDNVAFNPLLTTGIQDPANPALGGWGGRAVQTSTSPDLWTMVPADAEEDSTGAVTANYTTLRWAAAAQNDFAARIQWTLTSRYSQGNHAPTVRVAAPATVTVKAGRSVRLLALGVDPDWDRLAYSWYQYGEEGTYPGAVSISSASSPLAKVTVPADAVKGQTISLIVQVIDNGDFPLTRYDRVTIRVA